MTPMTEGAAMSTAASPSPLDDANPDTVAETWARLAIAEREWAREALARAGASALRERTGEKGAFGRVEARRDDPAPVLCIQDDGVRFARGLLAAFPFALAAWTIIGLAIAWLVIG